MQPDDDRRAVVGGDLPAVPAVLGCCGRPDKARSMLDDARQIVSTSVCGMA